MRTSSPRRFVPIVLVLSVLLSIGCASAPPPTASAAALALPSWRDGATRDALVDFVARVTRPGSPDFVPVAERIAVFDNDGTLWSEQPMYVQLAFTLDRIRALAPDHPDWSTTPPYSFVLDGDLRSLAASGEHGLIQLIIATHAGNDSDAFASLVTDWLSNARHPQTGRPYDQMIYQPMLELLGYLRAHDFATWIVSGGGIDFMRVMTEPAYGIPPQQVIGSLGELEFVSDEKGPRLERTPGLAFLDDKGGKPIGIWRGIGRRPILAVGNSDGDFEMLEWTTAGDGARLGVYLHHTDGEREVAYDRKSSFGRLDRGLDEAGARGWVVIDMARDWDQVFPPEAE